jgi:hypothetical protein
VNIYSRSFVIALVFGTLLSSCAKSDHSRAAIEKHSQQVMPFNMDTAMHMFTPTSTGGLQQVVVHNGGKQQIMLVRQHLKKEAAAFSRGDFSDPAYNHGNEMPGLSELERDYTHLSVIYRGTEQGGEIVYTSSDLQVIAAVHDWFKAQVRDHGSHAMTGSM